MDATDDTINSPGWDAIDAALAPLYGQQQPRHFGTLIGYALGGNDPLQGISAYWRDAPLPHWHFVTYGFSELYEKESENLDVSGWGFELTFRLRAEKSEEPPAWALNFLQNLARYVFDSGNPFESGHYINANGPIASDSDTLIRSIALANDPELPVMKTANGNVAFLQVVGLTDDEEFALKRWSTLNVLDAFAEHMPLWITDLQRDSLLDLPDVAQRVAEGAAREGSRTGYLYVDGLDWQQQSRLLRGPLTELVLGARQVTELLALLPGRLPFDRGFRLLGQEKAVVLSPATQSGLQVEDETLTVSLDPGAFAELMSVLRPARGHYSLRALPSLRVEVRPSEIRDGAGHVVETIG